MLKVGLLLPRSTYYNAINFDLYEGFRAGLEQLGRDDIQLITENIGFGTDQQTCYRLAEKMLIEEQVQVVFAYVSHRMAQLLRPLFMAANKLLIVLDAGANMPQEWPSSPNIIFHSLHNSLGASFSARKAVKDGHRSATVHTGYYDGGYLQIHAGFNAYENAGGRVTGTHATGYLREEFSITPPENSNCLLSFFSGDFIQWYFEELQKQAGDERTSVYLPPFGLEESVLAQTDFIQHPVHGTIAWSNKLDNVENQTFCKALADRGREANLFSLLGWEAARLANRATEIMHAQNGNGRKASAELLNFSFESPRGTIHFHENSHTSLGPMYYASVQEQNGKCQLAITETIPVEEVRNTYEEMISIKLENNISGWYNSYACI